MQIMFEDSASYDKGAGIVCFYGSAEGEDLAFGCTTEALMEAEQLESASERELMAAFTKHRDRIRQIARAKYISGAIERRGVCIVRTVDLNR